MEATTAEAICVPGTSNNEMTIEAVTQCFPTQADMVKHASELLSQQLWCFGQDIKRPLGNWLLEVGFDRIPPPPERGGCTSLYTLELGEGRRVVLRGFGVFVGDDSIGGLYIERFSFQPMVTPHAQLPVAPWAPEDLPSLRRASAAESSRARVLLLGFIDWMIEYEIETAAQLGYDYRRRALEFWNKTKRGSVPAEQMPTSWRELSLAISHCIWNPLASDGGGDEVQYER